MAHDFDVAIVGGGPAGSTAGTLLMKYAPRLKVAIFEREAFPRDHVGESQLPPIGRILREMGVWGEVERADFPIKVGATYRWGTTDELWDFDFVPPGSLRDHHRPAPFGGLRERTAFQVDRARFDKILLDHARRTGVKVFEQTAVREIVREGDRVAAMRLEGGKEVRPRYVIDASGGAGLVRRAMNVGTTTPTSLRNIAIWRYWNNAEWSEEIGVGGTRVYVMSLGYGWVWFIPLGPTRTSVGLIVPAEYYKETGERPEALYERAMGEDAHIASFLRNATPEPEILATKDWSFVADRAAGENWFLAGESAGFADPILAAGMTLAHMGGREAAYTILALEEGREDPGWLRSAYDDAQRTRLWQHIRFADYWYSANAQFTDLKEFTREIARDAGLDLDADAAFQWLGTGGFTSEQLGATALGAYDLGALKKLTGRFGTGGANWSIAAANRFTLDLEGAEATASAFYNDGRTERVRTYARDGHRLPVVGVYQGVIRALKRGQGDLQGFLDALEPIRTASFAWVAPTDWREMCLQALEAMIAEGWVRAGNDPSRPSLAELAGDAQAVVG